MQCPVYMPDASMMVALFAGVPSLTYFALSGVPELAAISNDAAIVTLAVLVVVRTQAGLSRARHRPR